MNEKIEFEEVNSRTEDNSTEGNSKKNSFMSIIKSMKFLYGILAGFTVGIFLIMGINKWFYGVLGHKSEIRDAYNECPDWSTKGVKATLAYKKD